MTAAEPVSGSDRLDAPEVRKRTSAGLFLTAGWSAFSMLLAFGGNIALARLLVPHDFGVFAIGATVLLLAGALSDGGLTAGLIRRPEEPSRRELRNLVALHLALTLPIAAVGAAVATRFGPTGFAIALMLLTLPLGVFATPGRTMFNRALLFQRVSLTDVMGLVAFYVWAITGAALGYGVWSLATGVLVRTVVSVVATVVISPCGFVVPLLSGSRQLLPLIPFGIRFQAAYIVMVARDQALIVVVAGVAGIATLGLWSFVYRLMQGPLVFFESVRKVGFPAMVRFLETGRSPAPVIEKSLGVAATAGGLALIATGAAAPELVPGIFGEQWRAAAAIVPTACLAVLVWGPVGVSTASYLLAAGAAGVVLRANILLAITWIAVASALLPVIGVAALGIGWLAGAMVYSAVLGRATAARTGARILRPLVAPVSLGGVAMGIGWLVTESGPESLLSALYGGATALGVFLGALLVLRRELLVTTVRFGADAVGSALGRRPAAPPDSPAPAQA
jgi:O-antigen/teichoic acid export membrane protein